jgi:protocatechuate 3,4-dioxygenase beta subunit
VGVLVGAALLLLAVFLGVEQARRRRAATGASAPAAPVATAPARRATPPPSIRLLEARVEGEAGGGGELEGRVVSSVSGQGVARAILTFFREGAEHTTASDGNGAFRFRAPAPGRYQLASASADGFLTFEPELGQSPIVFDARAGVRLSGVTLYLTPRVAYDGRVVDGAGKPIAGATVRVIDPPGPPGPAGAQSWTSDEKGGFVFFAPDWAMMEARHDKLGRGRAVLDLPAQSARLLTIKITEPIPAPVGPIAGVVVDERGPVDGALVTARCDGPHPEARTTTSPDGRFELSGLDDCAHRVTAEQRGLEPARSEGVRPGTRDLKLTLRAGASLRGRVLDGAGHALPAFTVMVRERRGALALGDSVTQSFFDGEGRFELAGLHPGPYEVQAAANGLAPSAPRAVDVPGEVELTLSRGGRVTGVVLDRASKKPLAGARVSVEGGFDPETTFAPLASGATSDGDGRFSLGGLRPGLFSLSVVAEGHNPRLMSGLRVEGDGDLGPLTIDLSAVAPGEDPRMEYVGIGAVLSVQGDVMLIQKVMPGGGAAEVGLQSGDAILVIDGVAVAELGFMGAVQRIRGPEGTTVELVVRRKDGTTGTIAVPRRALNQ